MGDVMTPLRLEFRTDKRGYTMVLDRDLWGGYVLWRRWYGLYNRRHGSKLQVFEREDLALREIERVVRRRERRGYMLLSLDS